MSSTVKDFIFFQYKYKIKNPKRKKKIQRNFLDFHMLMGTHNFDTQIISRAQIVTVFFDISPT